MPIYRGAGGAGDATADSASEALLVRELAIEVQADAVAADASAIAAAGSASSASTSATNASNSASAAATSATNAANSASTATTQATNAANSATAAQTAETAAELAETNAETAETNAASSASAASSSASAASTSATNAFNSATAASTSATNSANSATSSATSATNSANSATAAAGSATTATTQATNAGNSATAAASSATAAAGSATAAANSATAAQTAETNAETAETNAETAQAAAEAAQLAAETAQTAAELAETNAETAETNAETAETNAATSASAASGSASAAATSATNSSNSASAASTSATNASNSASAASTSASNAATSASNAATSATSAAGSATTATTQAGIATTQAGNASTSASNAATSASSAASAQSAAETARDQTLAAFDSFDDRYLGQKATAPTLDNDGNALVAGALYFNTTTNEMKVYDGTIWLNAYASLSGALLATNNLSDLNNTATSRTNLNVPTRTGGDASGTWGIDITGNAATATTATTATTANALNTSNSYTGVNFTATGSLVVGSSGTYAAGSLYSDANWGMIFRAKQASPATAQFMWANSDGSELFRFNGSALTTSITGNAATATAAQNATFLTQPNATWGARLQLGGNGGVPAVATTAVVQATDGNLHMDGGVGKAMYLNYYNNGVIYLNGTTYQISANGSQYNGNAATATTATTATNQSGGSVNATSGSFTGLITGASSASTDVNNANDTGSISIRGSAGTVASMSFHRTGAYAINMGVGTDNVFRIGGWSASPNCFQLTSVGDGTLAGSSRAPIFYDSNDTGYYVDPNSYSRTMNLSVYVGNEGIGGANSSSEGLVLRGNYNSNTWAHKFHKADNGSGVPVYLSQTVGADSWSALQGWGTGLGYTSRVYGSLYSDSLYSTIFYDANNTGYYCDPNSNSNLWATSTYLLPRYQSSDWADAFRNTPATCKAYHGDISAGGPAGTWWFYESMRHGNAGNFWGTQIAWGWEDNANQLRQRNVSANSFSGWVTYINSNNIGSQSVASAGNGVAGLNSISISDNPGIRITLTNGTFFECGT